jgi:hypothetical protein
MRGFAKRFQAELRPTDEWMKELREGEQQENRPDEDHPADDPATPKHIGTADR